MNQQELRPDHLYLVVQEKEILERHLIPKDVGILFLDSDGLRILQKSRLRKGKIGMDLFYKRVAETLVGYVSKILENNHG